MKMKQKKFSQNNLSFLKLKEMNGTELQKIVGGKKDFIIIIDVIDRK